MGVICLFEDTAQISNVSSFFAIPKWESVDLPGLRAEFSKAVIDELNGHGFKASLIPIGSREFWSKTEKVQGDAFAKFMNDGDYKAMFNAVAAFRDEGRIDASAFDAVLIIGPTQTNGDRHFLGRDGDSVVIYHNDQHPSSFSLSLVGTGCSVDLKTIKAAGFVGFGVKMQDVSGNPGFTSLDDVRNKTDSAQVLQTMIPTIKSWAISVLSLPN